MAIENLSVLVNHLCVLVPCKIFHSEDGASFCHMQIHSSEMNPSSYCNDNTCRERDVVEPKKK